MRRVTWCGVLAILAAIAAAACDDTTGSGGDPGGGNTPSDIEANWTLVVTLRLADEGRCIVDGMTTVGQSGESFEAEIAQSAIFCVGDIFTPHPDLNWVIRDGRVDDQEVSFSDEFCDWTGTASSKNPERVEGSLTCSVPYRGGFTATAVGNWLWVKARPLSSTPDLTGDWTLVATVKEVGSFAGVGCGLGTDVRLDQSGTELTGQIPSSSCEVALQGFVDLGGPLTGTVNANDHRSVRLTGDRCEYIGVLAGNPPYGVTGEVTCHVPVPTFDTTVVAKGPFRLRRADLP